MEWEKLYRDDVSSIYIKDNHVLIEDGMKITLKKYASHDIASFEARVIMVGFKIRYDKAHGIEIDFNDSKVIEEAISYFNELIDKYIEIYNS